MATRGFDSSGGMLPALELGQGKYFQSLPETLAFASALNTPWINSGPAKMPMLPVLPSQTISCFNLDINAQAGTNGVGWIVVRPQFGLTSDGFSVYYTTAPYAGTTASFFDITAAGVVGATLSSPYTLSDFSDLPAVAENKLRGRILGAGISAQYSGAELYRGGTIKTFVHPNRADLGTMSYDTISQYVNCTVDSVKDGREYHVTRPILDYRDPQFTEFNVALGAWEYGGTTDFVQDTNPTLVIAFHASVVAGAPLTIAFRCRVGVVGEVIGLPSQAVGTDVRFGHADPQAFHQIANHHMQRTQNSRRADGLATNPKSLFGSRLLSDIGSFLWKNRSTAASAAKAILNS